MFLIVLVFFFVVFSYECICDFGFVINVNKIWCEDIDECVLNNGSCGEYLCVNSYGSYLC